MKILDLAISIKGLGKSVVTTLGSLHLDVGNTV